MTSYCVVASGFVVHTADTVSFVAVFVEIVRSWPAPVPPVSNTVEPITLPDHAGTVVS